MTKILFKCDEYMKGVDKIQYNIKDKPKPFSFKKSYVLFEPNYGTDDKYKLNKYMMMTYTKYLFDKDGEQKGERYNLRVFYAKQPEKFLKILNSDIGDVYDDIIITHFFPTKNIDAKKLLKFITMAYEANGAIDGHINVYKVKYDKEKNTIVDFTNS